MKESVCAGQTQRALDRAVMLVQELGGLLGIECPVSEPFAVRKPTHRVLRQSQYVGECLEALVATRQAEAGMSAMGYERSDPIEQTKPVLVEPPSDRKERPKPRRGYKR